MAIICFNTYTLYILVLTLLRLFVWYGMVLWNVVKDDDVLLTNINKGEIPMKKLFNIATGVAMFWAMASALPASAANKLFDGGGDVYFGYTIGAGGAFNTDGGLWDGTRHNLDGGVHLSEVISAYGSVSRQNGYDCRECPTGNETNLDSLMGGLMTHWEVGDIVTLQVGGGMGAYRVRTDGSVGGKRFDNGSGSVSGFGVEGKVGINFDLKKVSGLPASVEVNLTAQHLGNGRVEGMAATGYVPGFKIIGTF